MALDVGRPLHGLDRRRRARGVTIRNAYPTPRRRATATRDGTYPDADATRRDARPPRPHPDGHRRHPRHAHGRRRDSDAASADVTHPEQPTLPPGTPFPRPGPDLIIAAPGAPAADLAVTHSISPSSVFVGQTTSAAIRVRNLGPLAAERRSGEVPQFRAARANNVVRVIACARPPARARASGGRRDLGTLAPGQVVGRPRSSPRAGGRLAASVVRGHVHDAGLDATNNVAIAGVARPAAAGAGGADRRSAAPAASAARFSYRVTATGRSRGCRRSSARARRPDERHAGPGLGDVPLSRCALPGLPTARGGPDGRLRRVRVCRRPAAHLPMSATR